MANQVRKDGGLDGNGRLHRLFGRCNELDLVKEGIRVRKKEESRTPHWLQIRTKRYTMVHLLRWWRVGWRGV